MFSMIKDGDITTSGSFHWSNKVLLVLWPFSVTSPLLLWEKFLLFGSKCNVCSVLKSQHDFLDLYCGCVGTLNLITVLQFMLTDVVPLDGVWLPPYWHGAWVRNVAELSPQRSMVSENGIISDYFGDMGPKLSANPDVVCDGFPLTCRLNGPTPLLECKFLYLYEAMAPPNGELS